MQAILRMNKGRDTGMLFLFLVVALLLAGLQLYRANGQPYTPPEEWAVSWASAAPDGVVSRITAVDYLPLDLWAALLGTAAPITRYLSVLMIILSFGFLFRLCADLFDAKTGLMAVVLLGTLGLVQNVIWQAQPYAALLMVTPAILLSGMRWMRHPTRKNALIYGVVGVLAAYICTFSILLIVAQAVFWLIFVARSSKWDIRTPGLLAAILLLTAPRLAALGQVNPQSGLPFSSWFALDLLRVPISIQPPEFAQLILVVALAVMAVGLASPSGQDGRLRWNVRWSPGYLLAMLILFFGLAVVLANLSIGSLYGMAVLPIVVLLAAGGLSAFPRVVQGAALVLAVIFALTTFRNPMPGMAYPAIIGQTDNAKLVIAAPYVWQHIPFLRYAPGEQMFHIMGTEPANRLLPPERTAYPDDPNLETRFGQFIDQTPEIWLYREQLDEVWTDDFAADALRGYDEITPMQRSWYAQGIPSYGSLRKFVRVPDDLSDVFVFGEHLWLRSWMLRQSVTVNRCERVTVQSWWSAEEGVPNNLSMTLVLVNAADGQGIANADGIPTGRDSVALVQESAHVDERSLQVPCDLPAGEYPLLIGIYELANDQITQLPVSLPDGTPVGNLAYLTTLFVQP